MAVRKTTRKTSSTSAPKPAAKIVATPQEASLDVVASGPEPLRKKELVEKIVLRSGIKKRDAKPVIEAMLAELGETLASGRELQLPPFGRVMINREKDVPNGKVMVVKIRQKTALKLAPTATNTDV